VLFIKTDLRLKRSVESSPIGRATDRDRARKAPQVLPHADVPRPGAFWISSRSTVSRAPSKSGARSRASAGEYPLNPRRQRRQTFQALVYREDRLIILNREPRG
jgi:hypothetical protein